MCLKHGSLELFLQEMKYFVYKVLYMFITHLLQFSSPCCPISKYGKRSFSSTVFIPIPSIKVWEARHFYYLLVFATR